MIYIAVDLKNPAIYWGNIPFDDHGKNVVECSVTLWKDRIRKVEFSKIDVVTADVLQDVIKPMLTDMRRMYVLGACSSEIWPLCVNVRGVTIKIPYEVTDKVCEAFGVRPDLSPPAGGSWGCDDGST